ncbi:MAG: hypothetical protein V1904_01985 [Bacteroidota bacterium]
MTLAEELREKGIRINCLAPGAVDTEMLHRAFPGFKANTRAEKMAEFIVDFSLYSSAHMNGSIIPVNNSTP